MAAVCEAGLDAVALGPTECGVRAARDVPLDAVVFDYGGREHLPGVDFLVGRAREKAVRVTAPVRDAGGESFTR